MVGAPTLAGAGIGGVIGAKEKEGDTPAKRLARILAYSAIGGAAGYGIGTVGDKIYKAFNLPAAPYTAEYRKAQSAAQNQSK